MEETVSDEDVKNVDEAVLENILTNHLVSIGKRRSQAFQGDDGIKYNIIKGGSQVGGDKMYDSLGYSYCVKKRNGNSKIKYWICSVRNQTLRCPATVRQIDGKFIRGIQAHTHLVGFSSPINSSGAARKTNKRRVFGNTSIDIAVPSKKSKHFTIVKNGSRTLMDQLKDSQGFTYCFKKETGKCRLWGCPVRNKYVTCRATVRQMGDRFLPGPEQHNHLPGRTRPLVGNEEAPIIPPGDLEEGEVEDEAGEVEEEDVDFSEDETHDVSLDRADSEGEQEDEEEFGARAFSGAVQRMISPKKRKTSNYIRINQNFSGVIELNVGGTYFTTLKSTLNKFPSSRLACMVKNDPEMVRDADERIFLDYDGRTFSHILTYLRNGTLPRPEDAMEVYKMAIHFQLDSLTESLEQLPGIQEKLYFDKLKESLTMEAYSPTKKAACQVLERIFLERKLVLELFNTCRHFTEKVKEYTSTVLQQYRAKLQTDCAGVKICHIRTVMAEEKPGMAACLAYDFRQMGYVAVNRCITLKKEGGEGAGEIMKGLFHCMECQKSCGLVEYVIVSMSDGK